MITVCAYPHQLDFVPHAIFFRPLAYFTMKIRKDNDDLDDFEGASFSIGNEISFDLRKYAGHPNFTVSVYLPMQTESQVEIDRIIDRVIKEFALPKSAVSWRRGWDFSPGSVIRNPKDRLREREAKILFLKIAALQPRCSATTTFVKGEVRRFYPLSASDRKPSLTRRGEQLWQQIVGNVIVHKSPFSQGLAKRVSGGLRLTTKGLNYLKSIGFAPLSASCD
jgi:hypothetical protein